MSCLDVIYASKMFLASNNKDKIRAAFENPINKELVTQLEEYLSDSSKEQILEVNDSKKEEIPRPKTDDLSTMQTDDLDDDPKEDNDKDHHKITISKIEKQENEPTKLDDLVSQLSEEEAESGVNEDIEDIVVDNDDEEKEVESASSIDSSSESKKLSEDEVKEEFLNKEKHLGLYRTNIKNNELWLYFNDDVNLNNIMVKVFELAESSYHDDLKFSRLARSENAMVFDIVNEERDNNN